MKTSLYDDERGRARDDEREKEKNQRERVSLK
jgi:hypothetical protein